MNLVNTLLMKFSYSTSMFPSQLQYSKFVALVRLQELFALPANISYDMIVRELQADEAGDYRDTLRMLRNNKEHNLIIDCEAKEAYEILRQVIHYAYINIHKLRKCN